MNLLSSLEFREAHIFRIAFIFGILVLLISCVKKPEQAFKARTVSVQSHLDVVAKVAGQEITRQQLYQGVETRIYELETELYQLKRDRLRLVILGILAAQHPQKVGLSDDAFVQQHVAPNSDVSDKDITDFISLRKIASEKVDAQLRADIRAYLLLVRRNQAIDDWITQQTNDNPAEIFIKKPAKPRFAVNSNAAPFKGPEDAPITIVEYSDFQCPFCKRGAAVVDEVLKVYKGKVKLVFKNYPLPFHHHAFKAAEAGLCAHEQNPQMFWLLHDWMFAHQQTLDLASVVVAAEELGLKRDEFEECLDSDRFAAQVTADIKDAQKHGVSSTPTFFINGKLLSGAHPLDAFVELIDEDLAH